MQVEHLYYRHDDITKSVDKATEFYETYGDMSMLHPASLGEIDKLDVLDATKTHPGSALGKLNIDEISTTSNSDKLEALCTFVYQHGSDRSKTRSMLCHIFHHALHDRFLEARDLLLMSHLQDTIPAANDISTMILFNRMMVTLGLCAFRLGKIWDAHQCLSDICTGRQRELLAQGVSSGGRYHPEKTPEQEKAEKRRQVPYHQHINLDLLEACHLISAMLLEVPNMAAQKAMEAQMPSDNHASAARKRVISRTFRKNHDIYERQVFTGPPEQTRDHVMCASKALLRGNWKDCTKHLVEMEVWNLVPGEKAVEKIKAMLEEKIKQEALRTYLFSYACHYSSLSLDQLTIIFNMKKNDVHSIVSKMIMNGDLAASWDQMTETIVLKPIKLTKTQVLALNLSEKLGSLVDANERLLDVKCGGGGNYDNWKGKGGNGGWNNDNNGGNHGRRSDNQSGNYKSGYRGNQGGGRGGGRGNSGGRGRGRGRGGRGGASNRGRGKGGYSNSYNRW